jgi:hypothetical protein
MFEIKSNDIERIVVIMSHSQIDFSIQLKSGEYFTLAFESNNNTQTFKDYIKDIRLEKNSYILCAAKALKEYILPINKMSDNHKMFCKQLYDGLYNKKYRNPVMSLDFKIDFPMKLNITKNLSYIAFQHNRQMVIVQFYEEKWNAYIENEDVFVVKKMPNKHIIATESGTVISLIKWTSLCYDFLDYLIKDHFDPYNALCGHL